MAFAQFKRATRPKDIEYTQAVMQQGMLEQQAKQQANALRSQNMMGAAELYNKGMGDKTPIADYLSTLGTDPTAATAASGAETLAPVVDAVPTMAPAATTGAELAGAGATGAELAGAGTVAAETLAPVAGEALVAGGTTTAGGLGSTVTGALSSMGPYGWAALAALALASQV